jgi:excisionase family DNA binding protein
MSPSYTAQAAPQTTPTSKEAIGHFFAGLDLLIRKAVSETVAASLQSETTSPPLTAIGGMELAREVTGLSKPRLYALVSERGIPHAKRGNKLFFNRAELLAWIAEGNRSQRKAVA